MVSEAAIWGWLLAAMGLFAVIMFGAFAVQELKSEREARKAIADKNRKFFETLEDRRFESPVDGWVVERDFYKDTVVNVYSSEPWETGLEDLSDKARMKEASKVRKENTISRSGLPIERLPKFYNNTHLHSYNRGCNTLWRSLEARDRIGFVEVDKDNKIVAYRITNWSLSHDNIRTGLSYEKEEVLPDSNMSTNVDNDGFESRDEAIIALKRAYDEAEARKQQKELEEKQKQAEAQDAKQRLLTSGKDKNPEYSVENLLNSSKPEAGSPIPVFAPAKEGER